MDLLQGICQVFYLFWLVCLLFDVGYDHQLCLGVDYVVLVLVFLKRMMGQIPSNELFPPNMYNVYRRDRSQDGNGANSNHGGDLFAISKEFISSEIKELQTDLLQTDWKFMLRTLMGLLTLFEMSLRSCLDDSGNFVEEAGTPGLLSIEFLLRYER
jgi:hypothetical protein